MALKYEGPCPAHPRINWDCKHCKAYWTRTGRYVSSKRHSAPIYRGLHWVAPDGALYAAALMRIRNEINSPPLEAA